ncbi:hypothetical protein FJZ21_00555 [Candidatus Pacearchaeota archaeon]|nr:hypothetical protein [Candidatus Pacearchaeota archaeon]
MAHGVESTGFQTVAKIFIDGKLRHYKYQENYGELGIEYNGAVGHWDFGRGLFVVRRDKLSSSRNEARGEIYRVSLEDVEAAVFPTEVAEVVRYTFPSREKIVKGYGEYADELESLNQIFDIDKRRRK